MAPQTPTPHQISVLNGYSADAYTYYPILIIGAGEAGICAGCRIKTELGIDQFRIFDRQSGVGGTWWINRYPGVACDVPCPFYSFSWAPWYTATELYPSGERVVEYLHNVASRWGIHDKVQLNTDVTELHWNEAEGVWDVLLTHLVPGTGDLSARDRALKIEAEGEGSVVLRRERVKARVVISGVGGLVEPKSWPASIPGKDEFKGDIFHSARWDESVSLKGKDVVVVGTGCSAAQIVPTILRDPKYQPKSVTQLMRSPPWVVPKEQEPFGKEAYAKHAPTVMTYAPFLGFMMRHAIALGGELAWFNIFLNKPRNERFRQKQEKEMNERMCSLTPKKYHKILTPDYSIGCKRRIFDAEWYRSMADPRFRLSTKPLVRLDPDGIEIGPKRLYTGPTPGTSGAVVPDVPDVEDDSAEKLPADVVILSNGFETATWLHPLAIYGRGGQRLEDVWRARGGPQAYLGTAVDGFPNFFMIFGPNTVTGHSSVILAIENMVEYMLRVARPVLTGAAERVEVREEVERQWARDVQRDMQHTVFMKGGCGSWYFDENGWNGTAYPRSQIEFWWRTRFPHYSHWIYAYTPAGRRLARLHKVLRASLVLATALAVYALRKRPGGAVAAVRKGLRTAISQVALGIAAVGQKV